MWDLTDNPDSIALIESFYNCGKPVAAVCHAPALLHRVTYKGQPIVNGKRATGFTNSEEEAVHLTSVVPFLVEDELKRLGGHFEKAPDWQSFEIVDGRLITGQNPASSTAAAQALLKLVARKPPLSFSSSIHGSLKSSSSATAKVMSVTLAHMQMDQAA